MALPELGELELGFKRQAYPSQVIVKVQGSQWATAA